MQSEFEYIREHLSKEDLLCQLAEEAAELAQAALKLRRAIDGHNPTPVSEYRAEVDLVEEMADVNLCIRALGRSFGDDDVMEIFGQKRSRWVDRLMMR